jgi:hypothetical protein
MLKVALDGGRVAEIRALSALDGHVPGFDAASPLQIRVLAPVPEMVDGQSRCRWFNTDGETKNGHSVVLRFLYKNVSVLLGGDLNTRSEKYLLGHYTSMDPEDETGHDGMIAAARSTFQSDIAKACHHGSGDFTDLFLRAVNAIATVVSSGDDEPHAHPRPDALGALGKCGRGDRPLVFSTELARSASENVKRPGELRERIKSLIARLEEATTDEARTAAQKKLDEALATLERSVAVYGLINLRTDGTKALLAQKLERRRPNKDEWDVHRLEPDSTGALRYVAKH